LRQRAGMQSCSPDVAPPRVLVLIDHGPVLMTLGVELKPVFDACSLIGMRCLSRRIRDAAPLMVVVPHDLSHDGWTAREIVGFLRERLQAQIVVATDKPPSEEERSQWRDVGASGCAARHKNVEGGLAAMTLELALSARCCTAVPEEREETQEG